AHIARTARAERNASLCAGRACYDERDFGAAVLEREATFDGIAADDDTIGRYSDLRADLPAQRDDLEAFEHGVVRSALRSERLQRLHLAELGHLSDELARILRLERVLVLDLRDQQGRKQLRYFAIAGDRGMAACRGISRVLCARDGGHRLTPRPCATRLAASISRGS